MAGVEHARHHPRPAAARSPKRDLVLERRVEEAEPPGEVGLDGQLALELRLQLELLGVDPLLVPSCRDEGPERAALVALDPVDRVLATVEAERRGEELRAEAARLELAA